MPSINKNKLKDIGGVWLKRNSRAVFSLLFLLVVVLGFIFLIYPQFKKIRETGTLHVQKIKNQLEERKDYLAKLKLMQENFDALNLGALSKLANLVYTEEDLPYLYGEVGNIFVANGLNIQSINIAKSASDGVGEVTINTTVVGDVNYVKLKELLGDIEKNSHLLNLDSLSYSPDKVSMSLIFTSYYLSDEGK